MYFIVQNQSIPVAQRLRDSFTIRSGVPEPEAIAQALVPPSTFRLVPVTNAASGLASQATSPAISSPDPYRPSAIEPRIWSAIGPLAGFITVSLRPRCTVLI